MKRFKTMLNENVHSRYKRSHGKNATGSGLWIFTTQEFGMPDDRDTFDFSGKFSDAKKAAEKHFKTKNIYVMESDSIAEGEGKYKGETWEDGYKRRVVKTTDPEHKEKGYEWRIKGKERDEISIKLYKNKPDFAEYEKQMKRVAGHEFGS